ncbi:MAG: hypothetical protein WEC37_03400 [Anaerolineales bacterium]
MNKWTRLALAAAALLLIFFSAPFWLPSALAVFAGEVEPDQSSLGVTSDQAIFIIDSGWLTGQTTQRVLAAPQLLAWSADQAEPVWASQTGFSYGGFHDAASARIFLIEQRNVNHESLLDLTIGEQSLYPPTAEWPLYLAVVDADNGDVISRTRLEQKFIYTYSNGIGRPIAVKGNTLYFVTYGALNNLIAYDLSSAEFTGETWDLCETSYPMQVSFSESLNGMATLCMDYSTGMEASLTFTPLDGEGQTSIDIPVLGEEEYMSGNGLLLGANGMAYVLDTDARAIVEVDLVSMEITRTVNYVENLQAQSSLGETFVTWLLEQSAQTAHAKRWMSMSTISPDGHWLAVDGGMGANYGTARNVFVIDLHTLQATQELELPATPTSLIFGQDNLLYAFLDKRSMAVGTRVIAFDLSTGTQSEFAVTMASVAWEVLGR